MRENTLKWLDWATAKVAPYIALIIAFLLIFYVFAAYFTAA